MRAPELVKPAHLWVPEHVTTAGGEAADLAASIGLTPDPEQRIALDTLLAENEHGKWAAFEGAVVAPRQNIKTFLFMVIALADLFVFGTQLIVWTAHEFSTSAEAFRQVRELVESYDHLRRRVKKITEANGEEGIELLSGQRLRFKARTKTGGRGLTGDRVILDEAFALQPTHMGSLMPTMSAMTIDGNPQILYGSSSGMLASTVLRSIRDRGRAGDDPFLAYLEWGAEELPCANEDCDHRFGTEGCQLDNRALWAQANLALGRRISIDFLAAERRSLPPDEFAREILGWWDDPPAAGAGWTLFDPDRWARCEDLHHRPAGTLTYALDVDTNTRGEEWCSVAASDGTHLEDVTPPEAGPGTSWVVPAVVARKDVVGELLIDPAGPAGKLIEPLEAAGIEIRRVTAQEATQACMHLVDRVTENAVRHLGQPRLTKAAALVVRRDVNDGAYRFSRKRTPGDISSLMAAAFACWGSQLADDTMPGYYSAR